MKKILKYSLLAGLIFGLIVAYSAYIKVFTSVVSEDTAIYIGSNDDYNTFKNKLKIARIMKDEVVFDAIANRMNLEQNLFPGKYTFKKGSSLLDVMRKFRGNRQTAVRLVINNVNFKTDLAGKVSSQLEIDSVAFYNFLNDSAILKKMGFNKDNIMCQFIPNTYEMYWSISLEKFLEKMFLEKERFWNADRTMKAKALNLSVDEVFILASIVEKEYKFKNERSRIAGVYLNRLAIRMPLQADPTCKFAWGDLSIKRVLKIHTQNEHPYNTYYINGLPPGPICLPETSTIDAVLNAEKHEFMYFCAHSDLDGKHEFNVTLTEHNAAARKYQKALNKLNIY